MGVSRKELHYEKINLQKDFSELKTRIDTVEKETTVMRNNLNAIHGALQQVERLIKIADKPYDALRIKERLKELEDDLKQKEAYKEAEKEKHDQKNKEVEDKKQLLLEKEK
jgi:chromosome segregation ATPase